jgi:hypothetical protein
MTEDWGKTVRLDARSVDEKIVKAFRAFLLEKHGKKRGVKNTVLSGELTKALRWYLKEEEGREFPTFLDGDSNE